MKPKQPKPVKMWAVWEPHFEYFVMVFYNRKDARDCRKNEEKVIRVTVTPEPVKQKTRHAFVPAKGKDTSIKLQADKMERAGVRVFAPKAREK